MSRTTKIVGISLPPEIEEKVQSYLNISHKTRSEFFRELISKYLPSEDRAQNTELDLANILRNYWEKRASSGCTVLPIILSIIVNKKGEILIGSRKEKDKWVENLTWVFPGGKLESLDFEDEVRRITKKETGLDIKLKQLITSRIHPDSGFKDIQIVALYFYCTTDLDSTKSGGSLENIKWVKPLDVFKYFTTSTCDEVVKFLTMIQKSSGAI